MSESAPRYSEDFSAAKALSQSGHINAAQSYSNERQGKSGGSNPRGTAKQGNAYNSRITMPSKKSQKRKKSTQASNSIVLTNSLVGNLSQGLPTNGPSASGGHVAHIHQTLSLKPNLQKISIY